MTLSELILALEKLQEDDFDDPPVVVRIGSHPRERYAVVGAVIEREELLGTVVIDVIRER